jgi:hypothetical protein
MRVLLAADIPTTDPAKLAEALRRYCQACNPKRHLVTSEEFRATAALLAILGYMDTFGQASPARLNFNEQIRLAALAIVKHGGTLEVEP